MMKSMTLGTALLGLSLLTGAALADTATRDGVAKARQSIQQKAKVSDRDRQSRYLDSSNAAIDKVLAVLDKEPVDQEAAKKELKGALILLIESARECASLKSEALGLAEALKAQGGLSAAGVKRMGLLLDLLGMAKAVKSSTAGAGLEQGMAIREIILALYELLNTGGHDFWRSHKALMWYLNALLGDLGSLPAAERAQIRQLIAELLDYLMVQGDLSAAQKARIMEKIDDFDQEIRDGLKGSDAVAGLKEVKETIRGEMRRTSEERKRRYREEAEREEREEREARESEQRQREQAQASLDQPLMPASPPPSTTVVQFTSLAGTTEVNRRAVGSLQGVYFVAADGAPAESSEVEADFSVHEHAFSLDFPATPKILGVVLYGTAGVIEIMQDLRTPAVTGIGPRDGAIDIRNTVVRETLITTGPNGQGLITGPIEDYGITIDGQPTEIIAAQPDQVTIESHGISGNATGQSEIVLTDRGGTVASGVADSWGYNVSAPEVTRQDVWVSITMQVFGVDPQELMRVTLTPTEGQEIEPGSVLLSGSEAQEPVAIAQLRTQKPGPQQFYVDVRREGR